MPGTLLKSIQQVAASSSDASPGNHRAHALASAHWTGVVMRAQDRALSGQHRPMLWGSMNVIGTWQGGLDTPGGMAQEYAPKGTDRTLWGMSGLAIPGHSTMIYLLAVPSGATEDATPDYTGGGGRVEITTTWDGRGASTATDVASMLISASALADNAPSTSWGGEAARVTARKAAAVPAVGTTVLALQYSESPHADMVVEIEGSPRILSLYAIDLPIRYAQSHNDDITTLHVGPPGPAPHDGPRTKSEDGYTYEERRWGTHRMLDAAERQATLIGPTILCWHPWRDATVGPTAASASESISTLTWTSLGTLLADEYDADLPGWAVPASYALRTAEQAFVRGAGAAVIPVRVRVTYRTAVGVAAQLRVQSSPRSAILIDLPDNSVSGDPVTICGYLEGAVSPIDAWPVLQLFARVTSAGAAQFSSITIEYGHRTANAL